ncbi:MAG: [ribosomal protein S18]-alanine N-acetyltransferase [Thermoproteota archaeon]|nr:[ribosomal protein S18]-alanine N-acetyltransferase [Thermoproteota archaeon]
MVEDISYRLFEERDLDQVVNINWTCLPENYNNSFFLELFYGFPKTFIIASVGSKIAGYIMCRIETGFSEVKKISIVKKGHVVSIAVIPEYRRNGIGYNLISKALAGMFEYRANECYLEVRVSNDTAINLYKKLGFKQIKTINGYYKDGESAYLMTKSLP